jgi:hypothetical protein
MISWPGRGRNVRDEADILLAFREWLKAHEGRVGKLSLRPDADGSSDDNAAGKAFHLSPGIAAADPSIDLKRLRVSDKRSVAKRVSRVIVRSLVIFALIGAAVAWQLYADDQTKTMARADIVKAWDLASRWLPPAFQTETRPGSDAASAPVPENSNQASIQNTAAPQAAPGTSQSASATPLVQPVPAPVAPAISPELQQKFEVLQDDLADLRRIVAQIAARQEEMGQDMVTLEVAQQTLTQRLSAPPQTPAAPPARRIAHPETAGAPRSVPGPTPYPAIPPSSR